jgi:hypothetical protein
MSWLSNHALNAMLTGASQLHRLRRCVCQNDTTVCQDENCLDLLMRNRLEWGGVYPIDKLPKSPPPQVSYIINSAPSNSAGEHWMAVRLQPDSVELFDSFGQPPWTYPRLYQWLKSLNKPRLLHLCQRIQGPNAYCGAYCYYFLSERPFCNSLYDTLFTNPSFIFTALDPSTKDPELLQDYLSNNDRKVFDYLYRHVQQLLSIYDGSQ